MSEKKTDLYEIDSKIYNLTIWCTGLKTAAIIAFPSLWLIDDVGYYIDEIVLKRMNHFTTTKEHILLKVLVLGCLEIILWGIILVLTIKKKKLKKIRTQIENGEVIGVNKQNKKSKKEKEKKQKD